MAAHVVRPDAVRVLERMKLMSTLPLNTGNEATAQSPPSILETRLSAFPDALSVVTRNIDTITAVEIRNKRIQQEDFLPEQFEHNPTPQIAPYRPKKHPIPPPGAYEPEYEATFSRVPQARLQPHDFEPEKRPFKTLSQMDVLKAFHENLREFEPSEAVRIEFAPEARTVKVLRPSWFFSNTHDREIVRNPSPGKDIAPAEPPPEKPPTVLDMGRQREQHPPTRIDPGRIHDEAVVQEMKMKSRIQVAPKFEKQTARNRPKFRNERVERLDVLALERSAYIQELSMKSNPPSSSRRKKRRVSNFSNQMRRPANVFPSQKADLAESAWPSDPIASREKTMSKSRAAVIYATDKELTGEQFWTAKRGHRLSQLEITSKRIEN
jgi:hypothetical protein